jgi:hypothetical protein
MPRCTKDRLSEEVIVVRGFRIVQTSKNRNQPKYVSLPRAGVS